MSIPLHPVNEEAGAPVLSVAERLQQCMRPGTLNLSALPPLSLYVHLPWCLKKCPYCDFNSHEWLTPAGDAADAGTGRRARFGESGALPEQRYIDALCADLEASLPFIWGRRVHSVFIGGGTPSLFSPAAIERLIGDVRARLPLEAGCEITMEANPGTFERDRFRAFAEAGVTRLSIGVQSFNDRHLQAIGRVHDAEQAREAVAEAARAFSTFNIDLMYALPGQTLAELDADLDTALGFNPPHLSIYHLTMEPNTYFAKHPPAALPDDDSASDMLDLITARTTTTGLKRYEVSAFARDGHRCTHNLNYWQFGDYLGIGAGAHGKLSFPHRVTRQVRFRDPQRYMDQALAGQAVAQHEEIGRQALPFEFMLNALRLREGFALSLFAERTGLLPHRLDAAIDRGVQQGLLARVGESLVPTERGFDFLSNLQELFLA